VLWTVATILAITLPVLEPASTAAETPLDRAVGRQSSAAMPRMSKVTTSCLVDQDRLEGKIAILIRTE
jgi:hypothetical protein